MSIVLDENDWAKKMIEERSIGRKPFETLRRIARCYIDEGCSKKEVKRNLEKFLLQCDPAISIPKWSLTVDRAMERALKFKAIKIDYIDISVPEMKKIDSLKSKQARRLAFTLLCLAKYWNTINPQGNYWVNSKDSEVMKMANINTSIKRQGMLYHDLNASGLIQFSRKVDNTNIRVCFVEEGDLAIKITDLRNLGYQYLKHHGQPYFECKNCGITTKLNNPTKGRKQRYCKECSIKVAMRQNINSVMRQRYNIHTA